MENNESNGIFIKAAATTFNDKFGDREDLRKVCMQIFSMMYYSKQLSIIKNYTVNDVKWSVIDTPIAKCIFNWNFDYHYLFCKANGFTIRFGKSLSDPDPEFCPLGPEILDLEISVNGCPTVGGRNCKFCYKNNTTLPPTNMTFDTFKKIFDNMPDTLCQIAFGITGTQTNPDFIKMMEYCREHGVIPNYTLSGADLTDDIAKRTVELCGACAVSCYESNKDLCYNTIKRIHDIKNGFHVNMHIVLSEDETQLKHVWSVLEDMKNKKIVGLRNIVFLRIKPVGRASSMNVIIHNETYEKICKFCLENNIGFGFDSCSARTVAKILTKLGHPEMEMCCIPCESLFHSCYINVKGIMTPCSFCEHIYEGEGLHVAELNGKEDFTSKWNEHPMFKKFKALKDTNCSCPIYDLDSKE